MVEIGLEETGFITEILPSACPLTNATHTYRINSTECPGR